MFTFGHNVRIHVTAADDSAREQHFSALLTAITDVTGGATVNRHLWGYWGPTGEYEPSLVVDADCDDLRAVLLAAEPVIVAWVSETAQECVRIVVDGRPFYLEVTAGDALAQHFRVEMIALGAAIGVRLYPEHLCKVPDRAERERNREYVRAQRAARKAARAARKAVARAQAAW